MRNIWEMQMNFMKNQIIRRNKKQKVCSNIYIYIYNLNGDGDEVR